jgi:nitrite reductase/ring-hydroxylating ferredoxin subunit
LDLIEGKVQSKNNDLLCANHGAKFNPETGECMKGPCKNSFLTIFPFKIINNYLIAGN